MSINTRSHSSSFNQSRRPRPASLAASDSVRRRLAAVAASEARALPTAADAYNAALGVVILQHRLHTRGPARTGPSSPPQNAARPNGTAASSSASSTTGSIARKALSSTLPSMLKSHMSMLKDSESKLPSAFAKQLKERLMKVLVNAETLPGYQDSATRRTFGAFLNQLQDEHFFNSVAKSRRVEDYLLIFISKGTAAIRTAQLDSSIDPDLLLDRHCGLFLRLVAAVLKDGGMSEKSPLINRLGTMEQQLVQHDPHIADNGAPNSAPAVADAPVDYHQLPLAVQLRDIFKTYEHTFGTDSAAAAAVWTPAAAMRDLKRYQTLLNIGARPHGATVPLALEEFESTAAYEAWRRAEIDAVNALIVAIINHQPDLAYSANLTASDSALTASAGSVGSAHNRNQSMVSQRSSTSISRRLSQYTGWGDSEGAAMNASPPLPNGAPHAPNPDSHGMPDIDAPFTLLPASPSDLFTLVLRAAVLNEVSKTGSSTNFSFSKHTVDLLQQLAVWWRVPSQSRPVLLMKAADALFQDGTIDVSTLAALFSYVQSDAFPLTEKKRPEPKNKRLSNFSTSDSASIDEANPRATWTASDVTTWKKVLENIHTALLRDLFGLLLQLYEPKAPNISRIMLILEEHIYVDTHCPIRPEVLSDYADQVKQAMSASAQEIYKRASKEPLEDPEPNLDGIAQFASYILRVVERVGKRLSRLPNGELMMVRPVEILARELLPVFVRDCAAMVDRVLARDDQNEAKIPLEEGFAFYERLSSIRKGLRSWTDGLDIKLEVEPKLKVFVERWLEMSAKKVPEWVQNSIAKDSFTLPKDGGVLEDARRRSDSSSDLFRILEGAISRVRTLNWEDSLQNAHFITALSRIVSTSVIMYCDIVEKKFAKELLGSEEKPVAVQQSQWERYSQMAREALVTVKTEPYQFKEESLVKLNNIEYILRQLDKEEQKLGVDNIVAIILRHKANQPPKPKRERFVFTVKIVEAEDLKACDMNGFSDPYVVVGDEFQKRLAKTRVVYRSLNPRWDESVDISATSPLNIVLTVWDWDALGDHDCVGRTSLRLDPNLFRDFLPRDFWLNLDSQGRILLRVSMEGERDEIEYHFGKAFRTLRRTEKDMTRQISDKLGAYIRYIISIKTLKSLTQKSAINMTAINANMNALSARFNSLLKKSAEPAPVVAQPPQTSITKMEAATALQPLLDYFNATFSLLKQTLTQNAMLAVMSRIWKDLLVALEGLLVPPLSDEPSGQTPLTNAEFEVLFDWLDVLFTFFNVRNEHTGVVEGIPQEVLMSAKYHDLKNLAFFYFQPTDELIRQSDAIAARNAANLRGSVAQKLAGASSGFSTNEPGGLRKSHTDSSVQSPARPPAPPVSAAAALLPAAAAGPTVLRRHKTVLLSRNLGTIRRAKEQKRRELQSEMTDDGILRILRMRPDARRYLKERARQKERLAAAQAAEMIVLRSIGQK